MKRGYPTLSYMGPIEDRLHDAFVDSYEPLGGFFRTPYAIDLLDRHVNVPGSPNERLANTMDSVIDPHLLTAEASMQSLWYPEILPVTTVAAAQARLTAQPLVKATAHQQRVAQRGYRRRSTRSRLSVRPSTRRDVFHSDTRHAAAAKDLTLHLVQHVNRTQRTKMRSILHQSITQGVTPDVTGARLANVVGLFPRWQHAVDNFHAQLLRLGWSISRANHRAKEYADSLLDKRGIMIARTELMRAMNDGRLAGWQDLAERNQITPESIKDWNASPDACDECTGIRPVYGVDTPFDTARGEVVMPPLHPHCRCTVTLRPIMADNVKADSASVKADSASYAFDEVTVAAFPEVSDLLDKFGPMEGNWR